MAIDGMPNPTERRTQKAALTRPRHHDVLLGVAHEP
jgi:hypothetical protein